MPSSADLLKVSSVVLLSPSVVNPSLSLSVDVALPSGVDPVTGLWFLD